MILKRFRLAAKNVLKRLLNDGELWHDGHDQVVPLLRELES
jgi:hypothetical protein